MGSQIALAAILAQLQQAVVRNGLSSSDCELLLELRRRCAECEDVRGQANALGLADLVDNLAARWMVRKDSELALLLEVVVNVRADARKTTAAIEALSVDELRLMSARVLRAMAVLDVVVAQQGGILKAPIYAAGAHLPGAWMAVLAAQPGVLDPNGARALAEGVQGALIAAAAAEVSAEVQQQACMYICQATNSAGLMMAAAHADVGSLEGVLPPPDLLLHTLDALVRLIDMLIAKRRDGMLAKRLLLTLIQFAAHSTVAQDRLRPGGLTLLLNLCAINSDPGFEFLQQYALYGLRIALNGNTENQKFVSQLRPLGLTPASRKLLASLNAFDC